MKPEIAIIKGTDDISAFQRLGNRGTYHGNTDIDHFIPADHFSIRGLFQSPLAIQHTDKLLAQTDGLLFNCISEPDINLHCLNALNKALKIKPRPIINHPQRVMKTRRDDVARTLTGVDGLIVPRVIRVKSNRLKELNSAIADARLHYPLLIRSAGSHNQHNLLKIDSPIQLVEASKLSGKHFYITEYHESVSPDGLYRKHRFFVFATGDVILRHLHIGPDWRVGVHVRKPFMAERPELRQEENAAVQQQATVITPRHRAALLTLLERLGLDYVGVDCGLRPEGDLLLFEANIAMNVGSDEPPGDQYEYLNMPSRLISEALKRLILTKQSDGKLPDET